MFTFAAVLLAIAFIGWRLRTLRKRPGVKASTAEIAPINDDFKWQDCKPLFLLPFIGKKSFNPSMGIRNMSKKKESLFLIENTYLETTNLRKQHLNKFEHKMLHCNQGQRSKLAVREFYSMATTFMTERYPHYFHLNREEGTIHNLINNEIFPHLGDGQDVMYLLKVLATNFEEDIVILLKDHPTDADEEYILRSSLTGSPAGFDPSHNFDKPLSFIHKSVPQYKSRLSSPMHRFFNKLEPKDLWQRENWSVQTNNFFFKLEDHHGRSGDIMKTLTANDIDCDGACYMRCERQMLTRLPKSRAIIMLVRTYLTPLKQIRAAGYGTEMAHAIESLPDDLAFYKRRDLWGKAVCAYLRS